MCIMPLLWVLKELFCFVRRRMTITDGIERSLKKGRGSEQAAAAQLAPLLCVQLGAGDEAEEVCKLLAPVLSLVSHDTSATYQARAKVT